MTLTDEVALRLADPSLFAWYRSGSEDIKKFDEAVVTFARAIEARVLEELRKQEPFCYLKEEWLHYEQSAEGLPHAFPVYAAPIPSTRIKDFSELRDELDAAPIPPTPSQEEANREASLYRWWKKNREVTLITAIYGNGCVNKTLADVEAFILARPDTEGGGK